jgi:hypothetical protein
MNVKILDQKSAYFGSVGKVWHIASVGNITQVEVQTGNGGTVIVTVKTSETEVIDD